MGFLSRLFGKKSAASTAGAEDRARGEMMAGRETGQTVDEQADTRSRMEAELDAQRERREPPAASST
ncbi:MAG: hypothetical protein AB7R89_23245 [Dehalococcoidia bacterium]